MLPSKDVLISQETSSNGGYLEDRFVEGDEAEE
jgi:hypothetical protein